MAEFTDVMKQFDRMCLYYQRGLKCPMGCPMGGMNISECRKIAFEQPGIAEKTVMSWAKDHPEPVYMYPTWAEWLKEQGFVTRKTVESVDHRPGVITYKHEDVDVLAGKAYDRIPADIAERLGASRRRTGEHETV